MKTPCYLVTDGDLTLQLWPAEEGGYNVTCPWDSALITQAETMEEAFEMARDARQALLEARKKLYARQAGLRPSASKEVTLSPESHLPGPVGSDQGILQVPVEAPEETPRRIRRRVICAGETIPSGSPSPVGPDQGSAFDAVETPEETPRRVRRRVIRAGETSPSGSSKRD
jgi:antitoxin HicB